MKPHRAAGLSIISNIAIVLLKFMTGIITGSVAILSEAIHSSLDLIASLIAYVSVRMSNKPPDRDHPYGHGKFENISGSVETLLIIVAGIWIIFESGKKLLYSEPIHLPIVGVAVMLIGAMINWIVGRIGKRVGEESKSVAMRSNALHLLTDVYSFVGVAVSLLVVSLTDLYILDPLIGIAIALFIVREAVQLEKESFLPLLDVRLEPEEEERIREILQSFSREYLEYHALRTRRSGSEEHIDLHLVVSSQMRVADAHDLCDRIEGEIRKEFPQAHVLIHIEPEYERHR
ncbi:cation diffusion facilitator family transporter [Polycladomyces subterraneus]|uniref:Cation diffusion facilitator family transporter n=1 Tax=Polycladomyces subterraneus TaxID=1016997 RepID=A0ABT8IK48_9BACL|nr:cation diffusion facilitator family transporter [Polycladomyces subterraneus]MDN4593137.1 cation diffusion facilitator family transporter [Polycladomyces subterraneus]